MIPPPASNEVHAWCIRLDVSPDVTEFLTESLSQDERNRSARLRFDHDRRRFAVAHGALRDLLGRYARLRPDDIRFVHNQFGKPGLSPELDRQLKFNLSHSDDLAVIAIAASAEVGVDVERVRPDSEYDEIARSFFSAAEIEDLSEVPGHLYAESFLKCWTQKEAYMKARGEGFGIPPTSFSVRHLDGMWSLHAFMPAPGYVGALAVEGTGWRVSRYEWNAPDNILAPVNDRRSSFPR